MNRIEKEYFFLIEGKRMSVMFIKEEYDEEFAIHFFGQQKSGEEASTELMSFENSVMAMKKIFKIIEKNMVQGENYLIRGDCPKRTNIYERHLKKNGIDYLRDGQYLEFFI